MTTKNEINEEGEEGDEGDEGEEFLSQYPELSYLVEECIVFAGIDHQHGWSENIDNPCKDQPHGWVLCLNMNDTFMYACADAEEFTSKDIPEILKIHDDHGWIGLICWAAKHRGYDPVVEYTEDSVYQEIWKTMYGDLKLESTKEEGRWSSKKLNLEPWVKNVRE